MAAKAWTDSKIISAISQAGERLGLGSNDLKLQFGQCNNERLTAVQSPASAAHSDQTQITRSSHRGRVPRGTDSIK